jgi:hypothetical protein
VLAVFAVFAGRCLRNKQPKTKTKKPKREAKPSIFVIPAGQLRIFAPLHAWLLLGNIITDYTVLLGTVQALRDDSLPVGLIQLI